MNRACRKCGDPAPQGTTVCTPCWSGERIAPKPSPAVQAAITLLTARDGAS